MSYRVKLTITIALLIAIAFGIGGTLMISTSFHASLETETQAALEHFESVQNTLYLLNSLGEQTEYASLSKALTQMVDQNMSNWQALLLKSGNDVIFQDGKAIPEQHGLPTPSANQCSYIPVTDEHGYGLLVLSVIAADDTDLELIARFDLSTVYNTREEQQKIYNVIFIAVILFGLVAAAVLSIALTRHLHKLIKTARQIAGGDLSKRSRIKTTDEFGQLSRDFDAMADKLQENLDKLKSDMERQERFMGAFAHELKTPMTSIIGFADLLRQGDLDENTRMRAAEYIFTEGRRLERLSFKLLDLLLLKKDELKMKQVWLPNFIREVEQALSPALKSKGIRLIGKAEQRRVMFEPDLVKSLLYNLIDNASKAMDEGGIIGLTAAVIPGGCQFQVVDNGRGMEPAELTRITEAFYRVDKARSRSQGGAGLGLSLCKQIAQLHNGNISFASAPGKGTRVTVTLYGKVEKSNE